jgi:putative ABC transport system permease protein
MARDRLLLLVWTLLVAFTIFLAIAGPRLVLGVVDQGAQSAMAAAGSAADIIESVTVGASADSDPDSPQVPPATLLRAAATLPARLPAAIRDIYSSQTVSIVSSSQPVVAVNGEPAASSNIFHIQLALLNPANQADVRVVEGRLPSNVRTSGETEVALSAGDARAAGLTLGSTFDLAGFGDIGTDSSNRPVRFRVVGIVAPKGGAGATTWADTPNLWSPRTLSDGASGVSISALMQPGPIAQLGNESDITFVGHVRLRLSPAQFSASTEAAVASDIQAMTTHPPTLGTKGAHVTVSSGFAAALSQFGGQARAALSQMSIMIAGVLATALAALILVARLIALRRDRELGLERARGASTLSVARRALVESVLTVAVGGVAGLIAASLVAPGALREPALLVIVLVIAVGGVPVQSAALSSRAWSGSREAANRHDRHLERRRRQGIRLAAEATVVIVAAAAVWSLVSRGLLQTSTDGVDPLLVATPVLFAAAVTLIVARVYPVPVRLVASFARRTRGALGLLGAVRAERAVSILPLFALTLASSLVLAGGLFSDTVDAGQTAASWQRIGADVRVDAPVSDSTVARVARMPGVAAAASSLVAPEVQLKLGSSTSFATMIAVDSRYPALVGSLPFAPNPTTSATARSLAGLAESTESGLPVVVDRALADQLVTKNIAVYYGLKLVPLRVVGVTDAAPNGYLDGPFFYVDLTALSGTMSKQLHAGTLLIVGPGADRAAASLRVPAADIHTRTAWLATQRAFPLVGGVQRVLRLSALVVALFALIALLALVVTGARERGRWLSLLRTLGMRSRLGWWLAFAELAPVVLAALVGGVIIAIGMLIFFEPSLGFDLLTGGLGTPPPTISAGDILTAVGVEVVLLVIAVLAENAVYRRDGLSRVLRVGDTV